MKIVFLDSATLGEGISYGKIEEMGTLICYPYTKDEDVLERVKDADVVISNKVQVRRQHIDAARKLKLICVAGTGTNNIDCAYAESKGIPVKNAVGYSTESVVQITFASLLSLINSISYYDRCVKSGDYSKSPHFTDTGRSFFELSGKNYGIIGMGAIGKRVAAIATAFGAKVSYYSTQGTAHCKDYPAVTLEELLTKSDIISIHAPLNEKTKNLIAMEELKIMKPNAYILNMGRGGIVNEKDLAQAINFGLIAGAAVDVYEIEPLQAGHPYLQIVDNERIILTPHIAWSSREARRVLVDRIAENIKTGIKSV